MSFNIEEDDMYHQQEVPQLGHICGDKFLQARRISLPTKWSQLYTVIAHTPLQNSGKPPESMEAPLLKHQMSALLNKISESDCVQFAQALPQPKSSADQNTPEPKASADQNVRQHQKATLDVAKWFVEANVFGKTPWPILFYDKYSKVEEAWRLAIDAKDH